ncbi:Hypothetical predicted protein [Pelobates cultripes]|uniref:Uncharacterized protein n=1 Tax=Pelobates cultripes TaxID=61616 RepID=A0AAD1T191_PELCU|nr:Hypothetical predicted protein [Pelobates cultripes]
MQKSTKKVYPGAAALKQLKTPEKTAGDGTTKLPVARAILPSCKSLVAPANNWAAEADTAAVHDVGGLMRSAICPRSGSTSIMEIEQTGNAMGSFTASHDRSREDDRGFRGVAGAPLTPPYASEGSRSLIGSSAVVVSGEEVKATAMASWAVHAKTTLSRHKGRPSSGNEWVSEDESSGDAASVFATSRDNESVTALTCWVSTRADRSEITATDTVPVQRADTAAAENTATIVLTGFKSYLTKDKLQDHKHQYN